MHTRKPHLWFGYVVFSSHRTIAPILDFDYVRMKDIEKNINFVFNTRSRVSNDRKKWTFNGNDDQHISVNVQWNLINLHEIHINCICETAPKKIHIALNWWKFSIIDQRSRQRSEMKIDWKKKKFLNFLCTCGEFREQFLKILSNF
jgi:hypothetical protein